MLSARSVQRASAVRASGSRARVVVCKAAKQEGEQQQQGRRQVILNGINVGVIAAIFNWGTTERPSSLGVVDYGGGVRTLGLCPPSPNCISTAEEMADFGHFAPPLTYNPQDGRGTKKPATREQAMQELVDVVEKLKPDNFTPKIVKRTDDYLYVEYESPTFGFVDDVEFFFPQGEFARVEYRSASRVGESDGQINRKRIKAIRLALENKGWASVGF